MYKAVPTSEIPRLSQSSEEEEEFEKPYSQNRRPQHLFRRYFLAICLLVSLLGNFISFKGYLQPKCIEESPKKSKFAGLERNIPKPWGYLASANEEEEEERWRNTTYDAGNIALDDGYAKSMGLPRAQRFPWDPTKGIYLINAYHNLHCVKTIRESLVEFQSGSKQTNEWAHIIHCVNVLRDEVMCEASDIPRYTGYQPERKSGLNQVRMCRDWNQLEAWAKEHTACWKNVGHLSDPGFVELNRYRYCPPGSPYEEMAKTKWLDVPVQ